MKGTVRPLAASVSAEEAAKAAKRVEGAIAEKRRKLDEFRKFGDENEALAQLVQQLPDSVSHRVMVPFGKAAFFPGKLVHTNEFLVLLGENHYAERSAKQTAEILHRRGELLARQMSGTTAEIADLEAELSFAANAAEEASAGMVEIREEVTGPEDRVHDSASGKIVVPAVTSSKRDAGFAPDAMAPVSGTRTTTVDEDAEHDRLMARLLELEMAEANAGDETEEEDEDDLYSSGDTGAFDPGRGGFRPRAGLPARDHEGEENYDSDETEDEDSQLGSSEDEDDERTSDDRGGALRKGQSSSGALPSRFAADLETRVVKDARQQKVTFQPVMPIEGSAVKSSSGRRMEKSEAMQDSRGLEQAHRAWNRDGDQDRDVKRLERQGDGLKDGSASKEYSKVQKVGEFAGPKQRAFTGTVTEHNFAEPVASNDHQVQDVQPSRPVSKFKMRHAQAGRR